MVDHIAVPPALGHFFAVVVFYRILRALTHPTRWKEIAQQNFIRRFDAGPGKEPAGLSQHSHTAGFFCLPQPYLWGVTLFLSSTLWIKGKVSFRHTIILCEKPMKRIVEVKTVKVLIIMFFKTGHRVNTRTVCFVPFVALSSATVFLNDLNKMPPISDLLPGFTSIQWLVALNFQTKSQSSVELNLYFILPW